MLSHASINSMLSLCFLMFHLGLAFCSLVVIATKPTSWKCLILVQCFDVIVVNILPKHLYCAWPHIFLWSSGSCMESPLHPCAVAWFVGSATSTREQHAREIVWDIDPITSYFTKAMQPKKPNMHGDWKEAGTGDYISKHSGPKHKMKNGK